MDRNREARRATMAATNGLQRRRHRTSSLRDSPEEDGPVELQETARLRDRGNGKKDRDRDRDRERERDRDRDRDRDRLSRNKRRRGDRLIQGNREDGGEDSSEESVNDEEEDDDDDGGGGGAGGGSLRMLPPPNPSASFTSSSTMQNHHRKSFPPAKNFRAASAWKAADEMIGVSVPRKARSASTKRSHEWSSAIGMVGESIHRQASTSPVRPSLSAVAAASPAPVSPSSSNASVRKKLKPSGPKLRQPKTSSKSSSSAQDDVEMEIIAEVLFGMGRQPQGPTKQEIMATDSIKLESRETNNNKSSSDANKSSSDAKSRVSSPISSSQYGLPQSSSRSSQVAAAAAAAAATTTTTTEGAAPAWALCIAPKRKKPRLVKYDSKYEESKSSFLTSQNNPISSTSKVPTDQPAKTETSSANLEKAAGSAAENGGVASDTAQSQAVPPSSEAQQPEPIKLENNNNSNNHNLVSDSKSISEKSENRDLSMSKEEPQSPKKESPGLRLEDKRETMTATKSNSTTSEIESQREEKFQIDLMAPPPSRSSPERDGEIDYVAVDAKPMAIDTETEIKPVIKEDAKALKIVREEAANVEPEKLKTTSTTNAAAVVTAEEAESKKPSVVVGKERNIDLQLDLEKTDRDGNAAAGVSGNKLQQQHVPRQQQQQPQPPPPPQQQANNEKNAQSAALPLPMSMAGWPGGLPPMGYMAPLQGVVSMDGSAVSSAALQSQSHLFNQPRPKRCATHCYIARSICYHQQIARMNPFWPAAAGSGSIYGAKPCNLNVLPSPADLHANIPGRGLNSVQDKGQGLAMFPGHNGKDKASQAASVVDAAQRKQILLQQALPPGAPSNMMQGPAIIFPLSQQQAVAAASVRPPPGSVKSTPNPGNATTSSASNSTSATASTATPAAAVAPAMTFNYPNISGNETQYLAINAYSFPIPAHVGAPPAYRGTHHQAMPFFNGSFYSTFHPSQLQQQQPPSHSQQSQQGHQNPSMSSGSSSSQKHLQNQQQRQTQTGGSVNGGSGGSLQGFPTSKNQTSQPLQLQPRQQHNQHVSHPARQLESEMGSEDSPSTADSRVSRPSMSIYGQNFAMPMHAPNFALMAPASIGTASGANGSNGEKKQQQQQGSKGGVEPSQAFAMSFASINGATTAPGLDISSIAQQQALFPDVRQGYQQYMVAAAFAQAAAQQKKNYRGPEEGKPGGDSSNVEEERKKGSSTVAQSIAFSRQDLSDVSGSAMPSNTVVDSSARTINIGSTQPRSSGSVVPASMSTVNASSQQQLQRNQQQQQQQMIQLHKQQQQQLAAAAARTKTPATSNGNVYSDHLPSSMAAKFPNALSTFPQNLVHGNSSPAQSPQWKNSARSTTSQVPSPSMTSSTSPSLKNLSQQQGRSQQSHTQISFAAANPKSSAQSQGLQPANSNQSPSPPIMVGSPTTSSMSKSAGGSPRTNTSTSTGNKVGQASSLSSQQAKNSSSVPGMKSSPVAGKNVPSILGNPHITSSSSSGNKTQLSQQQQQQQLSKQALQQQAQIFFSSPYITAQAPHSNSTTASTAAASAYYSQRRRPEQQQQPQSTSGTSSSGMLSLCPSVTLANTSTSDAKAAAAAAAAAASNMKGGGLASQALMHPAQFAAAAAAAAQSGNPHQLLPAGFPYVHAVPTAVQVKPAEQKQPAGE